MGKDKLIILIIFAMGLLAGIGFRLRGNGASEVGPTGAEPLKSSSAGEFRGISLQLHNSDPEIPYEKYVDEIAETGANTICFVVHAYQENCSSTSIFLDARKTLPNQRIKNLISHARRKKLKIVLMPLVLLENPRKNEWRGKISPTNWSEWWNDYYDYILRYAKLSQEADVDVFVVGSELLTTQKHEDRWRFLIRRCRKIYKGKLSYSANWDRYYAVKWWDAVDIIGMTTYHDLAGGDKPTVDRLMKSWAGIKKEILAWQAKINRPILFTEVGWPNLTTCARYPWNYCLDEDPDPAAQANCFEAFFRTWAGEKDVAGFLVWEWRSYPAQKTGPDDPSYVPCGKPSLEVIRRYLQYPSPRQEALPDRPAETTTAPADIPATPGR
ncbi:MAG: hypothetical protein KAU28_04205 [Phycisphaerae bacterium]|nr:hypothetical protein [Phycisphaerae bacterium]